MVKYFKYTGFFVFVLCGGYFLGSVGCKYQPEVINGCNQKDIVHTFLYGLFFASVIATMFALAAAAFLYIRLAIILPVSAMLTGDEGTLDHKLSGWLRKLTRR